VNTVTALLSRRVRGYMRRYARIEERELRWDVSESLERATLQQLLIPLTVATPYMPYKRMSVKPAFEKESTHPMWTKLWCRSTGNRFHPRTGGKLFLDIEVQSGLTRVGKIGMSPHVRKNLTEEMGWRSQTSRTQTVRFR